MSDRTDAAHDVPTLHHRIRTASHVMTSAAYHLRQQSPMPEALRLKLVSELERGAYALNTDIPLGAGQQALADEYARHKPGAFTGD